MDEDQRPSPTKLSEIDARLRAARPRDTSEEDRERQRPNMSGLGMAFRIGIELISTTLVGVAIGWFLDDWLGTRPWLMIVFLMLGGAAGVMNVYRVVKGLDDSVGLGQAMDRKARGQDDDGSGQPPTG